MISSKIIYFAVSVFVVSLACYPVQSDDLFMYLAIARNYVAQGHFASIDPFLFSLTEYLWTIMHQWLGYLIYYGLYQQGGFDLIIIFKTTLVLVAFALPIWLIQRPMQKLVWAGSVALAILAMAFRLMERTSLFSDLFIVLLLFIFISEHQRPSRLKYLLPLIFLAWVNLHPVFPIGWGLCLLFLLTHSHQWKTLAFQKMAGLTFLSIVVCWFNPKGIHGLLYPFHFAANEGKVFRDYYFEWMPTLSPLFRFQPHTYFLCALVGINLFLLWSCRRGKLYFETLASIFFIIYGFYAIRFVPTLGFALVILNTSLSKKLTQGQWSLKINHVLAAGLIALALKNIFFGYVTISGPRTFGLGLDKNVIPVEAAESILKTPQIGNVFNSHMYGSYLAWAWLEQRKIFYHGFVTDTNLFLNEYAAFSASPEKFRSEVQKYQIGAFLLDRFQGNERLIQILVQDPGWALAFKDDSSLIFLPLQRND